MRGKGRKRRGWKKEKTERTGGKRKRQEEERVGRGTGRNRKG